MYLSKLVLDPHSRQVQRELGNRYELHRTLASAFSSEIYPQERLLYRLETSHTQPYLVILLQSMTVPEWSALAQKSYLQEPVQVKHFEPRLQNGERFLFRMVANPTRRLRGNEKDGKRVALYREEDQLEWILRKAGQHGFKLRAVQITNLGNEFSYKVIDKERKLLTHHGVRFEGVLEVLKEEPFRISLERGIGSGKGFGFGLLSLARA